MNHYRWHCLLVVFATPIALTIVSLLFHLDSTIPIWQLAGAGYIFFQVGMCTVIVMVRFCEEFSRGKWPNQEESE